MLLFLKAQLVASFCIGFFIWNSPSTSLTEEVKVFHFSCEDGPEARVTGEILSISTQHAEITQIQEMSDHVVIAYRCLESEMESGITIIAVEDVSF